MTKEQRAERSKYFSHLGVEMRREQHEKLKEVAKAKDVAVSQLVRNAISDYLAKC